MSSLSGYARFIKAVCAITRDGAPGWPYYV